MIENAGIQRNDEPKVDIMRVIRAVLSRAWLVAAASVLCAVLVCAGTLLFVAPKYKSTAMFYVNNNALSVGDASLSISSGDLVTSRNLVSSYIVILKTRETIEAVIDYADVERSYKEVREMITAAAVDGTEVFQVVVTGTDPYEAEAIASAVAHILPKRIGTIIEGTSAKVVDAAVVPSEPSSPSYTKIALLGFAAGFVLAAGAIALREILDTAIHAEEDVERVCAYPILAMVPDMTLPGKGSKYYGRGEASAEDKQEAVIMGKGISFAAGEAYKLLRTKLQFSFAGEADCRVIGLSGALGGEGKSLTAVNLACTLSELGKRVVLMDCDMRCPSLAEKLNLSEAPGLSSYLTGQSTLEALIRRCDIGENEFGIISAGQVPPNPVELLSSVRMKSALNELRGAYDYVILDLPPVGEVADAMAVARETDGMLLVVRQNYCDRTALANAVRQFEFVETKILGIVFNCAKENNGGYYNRMYSAKNQKRFYGAYGRSNHGQQNKETGR